MALKGLFSQIIAKQMNDLTLLDWVPIYIGGAKRGQKYTHLLWVDQFWREKVKIALK